MREMPEVLDLLLKQYRNLNYSHFRPRDMSMSYLRVAGLIDRKYDHVIGQVGREYNVDDYETYDILEVCYKDFDETI